MHKRHMEARHQNAFSRRWIATMLILPAALTVSAQAPNAGFARPLADVRFPAGPQSRLPTVSIENGDLKSGPSTAVMKAAPNCTIPAHYHTAEEQLLIVRGEVSTGMPDTVLGPGGFAMMASKQVHWSACTAKQECLMFVTFDRPYDIVGSKDKK